MQDTRFGGPDEWLAAVERALARVDARRILIETASDREVVLAVALVEVSAATAAGVSTLSHLQLAQLSGLSRSAVLRARLALVEFGLEDVVAAPGPLGPIQRQLRQL